MTNATPVDLADLPPLFFFQTLHFRTGNILLPDLGAARLDQDAGNKRFVYATL